MPCNVLYPGNAYTTFNCFCHNTLKNDLTGKKCLKTKPLLLVIKYYSTLGNIGTFNEFDYLNLSLTSGIAVYSADTNTAEFYCCNHER